MRGLGLDTHTLAIKLVCGSKPEIQHQGFISEAGKAGRLLIIESYLWIMLYVLIGVFEGLEERLFLISTGEQLRYWNVLFLNAVNIYTEKKGAIESKVRSDQPVSLMFLVTA